MRSEFPFPSFEELQLGPFGSARIGECGCLVAKARSVAIAAGENYRERERLFSSLEDALLESLGVDLFFALVSCEAENTLANRRRAYKALRAVTDEVLGVEDA